MDKKNWKLRMRMNQNEMWDCVTVGLKVQHNKHIRIKCTIKKCTQCLNDKSFDAYLKGKCLNNNEFYSTFYLTR